MRGKLGSGRWLLSLCLLGSLWFVVPPAQALEGIDLTARLEVRVLGPRLDHGRSSSTAVVSIRNTSGAPVYGPLSVLVTRIDVPGVSLVNSSWQTPDGTPLVDVRVVRDILKPGARVNLELRFSNPNRVRRFTFGYAIFGVPNPPPARAPRGVEVVVTPVGLAPGEPVIVSWRPTGGKLSLERRVQIRARAPGAGRAAAGPQWSNPGLAPPAGSVFYLAPAGTWQEQAVAYRDHARAGRATFGLPAAFEGAWLIEVALVDSAGGEVRAVSGRTIAVSREPAVYLRLARSVASSLDSVRATLVTAAGTTPRPVRLLAWLVAPDGAQDGLPGLSPNAVTLYAGPSRAERITLLDRVFGANGHGAYQVHARLFDTATGALIGRASAGFEVCDTPGTLSGVVRDASGAPLGAGASLATVRAIDVGGRYTATDGAVEPSGAYALTLSPGRYTALATVIDAGGVHQAQSASLVDIGCAGMATTLDLTAAAPTPRPSAP